MLDLKNIPMLVIAMSKAWILNDLSKVKSILTDTASWVLNRDPFLLDGK